MAFFSVSFRQPIYLSRLALAYSPTSIYAVLLHSNGMDSDKKSALSLMPERVVEKRPSDQAIQAEACPPKLSTASAWGSPRASMVVHDGKVKGTPRDHISPDKDEKSLLQQSVSAIAMRPTRRVFRWSSTSVAFPAVQ